jgi:uncharacterized protein
MKTKNRIKNLAGQVVRGENFFERPALTRDLQQKIKNGSSVLISAPRRVGKTSLMFYVKDKGMDGFSFLYLILESVNSENEYFKRILNHFLDANFLNSFRRISKKSGNALKNLAGRITQIGKDGITLDKESSLNYRDEFVKLIKEIDLEGQKLVLLIDEFSQIVENIIEDEGKREAIHFLQSNRELRQDPEITGKLQFVIAGSIGLENIVSRLDSINLINDLDILIVRPLDAGESIRLMEELTGDMDFSLTKDDMAYILEKIQWYIPFYIQLAVREISDLCHDGVCEAGSDKKRVTKKIIDAAFARILELRNYFEHWQTRLRKAFKKEEYTFAKELLNTISREENIGSDHMLNLAKKYKVSSKYMDIVKALVYDGYINHNDDPGIYRFNSPLLRMWWRNNVAD